MHVDTNLICKERERRAWSQEQLANVAGLGLRTIQRIESSGSASLESVAALASVLEVPIDDLCVVDERVPGSWRENTVGLVAVVVISILLAGGLLTLNRVALADQDVLLEVDAVVNGEHQTEAQVLNRAGENTEVMIWEDYRLIVAPTALENGDVRMALQIQRLEGGEYVKVASPRIVTPNGKQAIVESGWRDGDTIVIEITPTIQSAAVDKS